MPLIPTQEPPYYQISDTPGTSGIKKYVALLAQATTAAPTVTILENTIGNIAWTRTAQGDYRATLAGAFTANKTIMPPFNPNLDVYLPIASSTTTEYNYSLGLNSEDELKIYICKQDYTAADLSEITNNPLLIQIYVYP